MRLKFSNKLKLTNVLVAIILLLVISNTLAFVIVCKEKGLDSKVPQYSYTVSYYTADFNHLGVPRYVPRVKGIEDPDLREKFEKNMRSVFLDWMPEKFKYPEQEYIGASLSTERYLSITTNYTWFGKRRETHSICNTFDMLTGDVVYLDDLVEVDEELVSLLLTEGFLKVDYDHMTDEHDAYIPQENLDRLDPEKKLKQLQMCSEPYDAENWVVKPSFYLEKDRLYLISDPRSPFDSYVEQEAIRHKVKGDGW